MAGSQQSRSQQPPGHDHIPATSDSAGANRLSTIGHVNYPTNSRPPPPLTYTQVVKAPEVIGISVFIQSLLLLLLLLLLFLQPITCIFFFVYTPFPEGITCIIPSSL